MCFAPFIYVSSWADPGKARSASWRTLWEFATNARAVNGSAAALLCSDVPARRVVLRSWCAAIMRSRMSSEISAATMTTCAAPCMRQPTRKEGCAGHGSFAAAYSKSPTRFSRCIICPVTSSACSSSKTTLYLPLETSPAKAWLRGCGSRTWWALCSHNLPRWAIRQRR